MINETDPVGYNDRIKNGRIKGLNQPALLDIATVHEQTHALCDLSYSCNRAQSRLGTWNAASNTFDENCREASAQRVKMEVLWATLVGDGHVPEDRYIAENIKDLMNARIGYGASNLVDIDTVVNELCLLVNYLKLSKKSETVSYLIALARMNTGNRAIGRELQR